MHFVDEVHLVATPRRRVLHVLQEFARVLDLGAGGRVDLDQVDESTFVDFTARRTPAARLRTDAVVAVERFGEQSGDRGLTDTSGAGEQKRVVDSTGVERVGDRADDVLLADEFAEGLGSPLAGKDEVAQVRAP